MVFWKDIIQHNVASPKGAGTELLAPCPPQSAIILGTQPFGKGKCRHQLHGGFTAHLSVKNPAG